MRRTTSSALERLPSAMRIIAVLVPVIVVVRTTVVQARVALVAMTACASMLTMSASVHAQTSNRDSVSRAPASSDSVRALRPGDAVVDGRHVTTATVRYALTLLRDGAVTSAGQVIDETQRDSTRDRVLVRRVQTVRRGTAQLIDSTVSDGLTLAPRMHRSLQPTRRMSLDFNGRRVKASIGPVDAPLVPVDTALPFAAFDSGNWDLLVRSLPLEKGYSTRFAVFDLDAGLKEYEVKVTGSTVVQDEDAHVVIFTIAKGRESVVWIGKQSRRLLRIETMLGPTMMLQQERVREP